LGLALILCGILALLISIWQYRWGVRYLRSGPFAAIAGVREGEMRTPVLAVTVILICVGLFAFFAVLFRLT
jgi:putative membrane protein